MELKFEVSARIAKPIEDVFEAVVNPDKLSHFFISKSSGRLEAGTVVQWSFPEFPGSYPVEITAVDHNEQIVLLWDTDDKVDKAYKTKVTMRFETLGENRTLVTITEEGWKKTQSGLKASYGNCMGWSQMLCAMKAWLEYDINLRDGMYA